MQTCKTRNTLLAVILFITPLLLKFSSKAAPTTGPLRIHPTKPRYFTDGTKTADGSWKAVYLTGSHTWTNLIDRSPANPPQAFDFDGYLDLLQTHHHNFIRLWGRQISWYQKYGEQELHAGPLTWPRTGPNQALDGKPRFDLTKFDASYFGRLHSRVKAADERGIYISIMLFGGFQEAGPNWSGNPFHRANNINGIDGDPNKDGAGLETQTLAEIPKDIAEAQKAYIRKVVDTVNDFDNVLFEISNESAESSWEWQYDLIRFIHSYEKTKPKQHPVGMTATYGSVLEVGAALNASPADWVSFQFEFKPPEGQEQFNVRDPFIADGRKVSIQDSDHWFVIPIRGNPDFGREWVWKSFCRGHNPILMEHLPPLSAVLNDLPPTLQDIGYIASRTAMGQTQRYAEKMNLAAMSPQPALASTQYCLANPGREYLVYLPQGGEITVDLSASNGDLKTEWLNPASGEVTRAANSPGGAKRLFTAPFTGDAVLYLRK